MPAGTGLAFPEFAAALRAQQVAKQQLRLQAARQRGNIWAASADDAAAEDADAYDHDDGGGEDTHGLMQYCKCWHTALSLCFHTSYIWLQAAMTMVLMMALKWTTTQAQQRPTTLLVIQRLLGSSKCFVFKLWLEGARSTIY